MHRPGESPGDPPAYNPVGEQASNTNSQAALTGCLVAKRINPAFKPTNTEKENGKQSKRQTRKTLLAQKGIIRHGATAEPGYVLCHTGRKWQRYVQPWTIRKLLGQAVNEIKTQKG